MTITKRKAARTCSLPTSVLWPGPGAATWPGSTEAFGHASPRILEIPTGLGTRPPSCFRMCASCSLISRITWQRTPTSEQSLGTGNLGSLGTRILVTRIGGKLPKGLGDATVCAHTRLLPPPPRGKHTPAASCSSCIVLNSCLTRARSCIAGSSLSHPPTVQSGQETG